MKTENVLRFGLKENTIDRINAVFFQYPDIEKVMLYGSRAKGNYREGTDIDLTLVGDELSHAQLNRIETKIDDLLLPYTIDLSIFEHIDNANLINHIRRVGVVFYSIYFINI
ncbi:MAG TPA: nucleotidyltransferase domain-containing protein [Methanosarcinaceae archaeon]|nr:nucleotidyltransferase domain-containing protein [Methanosarcinaceae archaeon]